MAYFLQYEEHRLRGWISFQNELPLHVNNFQHKEKAMKRAEKLLLKMRKKRLPHILRPFLVWKERLR